MELIRLEDEQERAVAWLAPNLGANCIAYAVQQTDGSWSHVLRVPSPHKLHAHPTRYGCPVLFPFPGYVRDARYHWGGTEYRLPVNAPRTPDHVHGFAHTHSWHVTDVARTQAVTVFSTAGDLTQQERTGYPFDVSITLSIRLTGRALVAELTATNDGATVAPVGFGFHPYIDISILGSNSSEIQVFLPGKIARTYAGPYPTREQSPVQSAEIQLPSPRQDLLLVRTQLGERPTGFLTGHQHLPSVCFDLAGSFSEIALWAPSDGQSVALEPTTCTLSAASQLPGDSDGMCSLEPGQQLHASMTLSLVYRGHT